MMKILFVCTGNTCRSPMAEGLFRLILSNDPVLSNQILHASAGIIASEGQPASEYAIKALLLDYATDISHHRSQPTCGNLIKNSDLVLCMTRRHKNELVSLFPQYSQKIHTLKGYILETPIDPTSEPYNYSLDIQDPYGLPLSMYQKSAAEIYNDLLCLYAKLKKELKT